MIDKDNFFFGSNTVVVPNNPFYREAILNRAKTDYVILVSKNCSQYENLFLNKMLNETNIFDVTKASGATLMYSLIFILVTIATAIGPFLQPLIQYIFKQLWAFARNHRLRVPSFNFLNSFNFHNSNSNSNSSREPRSAPAEHGQFVNKPNLAQKSRNPEILLRDMAGRSNPWGKIPVFTRFEHG